MTAVNGSGLNTAGLGVTVGSTVTRIYWTVPALYTVGVEYDTLEDALDAAIERAVVLLQTVDQPRVTVDQRWTIAHPDGGGVDAMVERFTYPDVYEAREHLARIRKYRVVV